MRLIRRMLRQYCVYWAPSGTDNYGQPTYREPVEMRCRWEDNIMLDVAFAGRTISPNASIYLDADVVVGGVLWLGRLEERAPSSNPYANENAFEIVTYRKIPTIRADFFIRIAGV